MGSWARGVVSVCAAMLFAVPVALAGEADRIVTDRPSVSTSASTILPGAFQIESGMEYSRARVGGGPDERRFALDVTMRAGITERIEIGIEGEPLVRLRGAEDDTGNGDVTLKGKYRLLDSRTAPTASTSGWWAWRASTCRGGSAST